MTDQTDAIDPEEAAREAVLRQQEIAKAAERQAAFDADWAEMLSNSLRVLAAYGVTEITGYPGWDSATAGLAPKADVTGDAAVLAWIVTEVHRMLPDTAARMLPTSAPWLKPIYQVATGQPITPTTSIQTITFSGDTELECLGAIAYDADAHGAILNGMLPETAPEPAEPSPWAGVLRKVQ